MIVNRNSKDQITIAIGCTLFHLSQDLRETDGKVSKCRCACALPNSLTREHPGRSSPAFSLLCRHLDTLGRRAVDAEESWR